MALRSSRLPLATFVVALVRRHWQTALIGVTVVLLGALGWPGWWRVGPGVTRPGAVADILLVAEVGALLAWRRWPIGCFVVAEVALVAYGVAGYPTTPAGYAGLVATAVGAWGAGRNAIRYACLLCAVGGVVAIGTLGARPASGAGIVANVVLVVAAWLIGVAGRSHQQAASSRENLAREAAAREAAEARLELTEALHDRVGHSLVGVLRQLEAARALGGSDGAVLVDRAIGRVGASLAEVAELVTTGRGSAQLGRERALDGIGPGMGREGGKPLGQALGLWVATLASAGTSVHLCVQGDAGALPAPVEAALAGALGEALANVARHSNAPEVTVALVVGPETAAVSVSDPGPPRPDSAGSGCGLARQRQTLEQAGGHLWVGPGPTGGFCLQACLPVHAPGRI